MVEPFKNFFNETGVRELARHLKKHDKSFNKKIFTAFIMDGFDILELKQRSERITQGLTRCLPENFPSACDLLIKTLHPEENFEVDASQKRSLEKGITGWLIMPMAQFVADNGKGHIDLSLSTLKEMTKRFSSEFAIRPFIADAPEETLAELSVWSKDENFHVRRLVSEGSRPLLPWGMRLTAFVEDPSPILPLLERLKDDPEEYVRRSVANNLNDISKSHPDLVVEIVARWLEGASKNRTRLIHHACRSLIKSGHRDCLTILGYAKPLVSMGLDILTPHVRLGQALEFNATLTSCSKTEQALIIDFIVHHMKANGKRSPKVFKWKTMNLKAGDTVTLERRHVMKKISTRTYYSGEHRLEIQINGEVKGCADFNLDI